MSVLLAGDLTPPQLAQFLAAQSWSQDTLCMAFAPHAFRFEAFTEPDDFLAASEDGRVFGPRGECRWRKMGSLLRTVYLGESCAAGPAELEDLSGELEGLTPGRQGVFLWGVRTDLEAEWIEQQVPHRFVYPVEGSQHKRGRVRLVIEEWRDGHGTPRFSRFHHLEETKAEAGAETKAKAEAGAEAAEAQARMEDQPQSAQETQGEE